MVQGKITLHLKGINGASASHCCELSSFGLLRNILKIPLPAKPFQSYRSHSTNSWFCLIHVTIWTEIAVNNVVDVWDDVVLFLKINAVKKMGLISWDLLGQHQIIANPETVFVKIYLFPSNQWIYQLHWDVNAAKDQTLNGDIHRHSRATSFVADVTIFFEV